MRRFQAVGLTGKERQSAVREDPNGIFVLHQEHADAHAKQEESLRALGREIKRLQNILAAAMHPDRAPVAWGIFSRGQYVAIRDTEDLALGEATHLHALNGTFYEVRPLWGKGPQHD